jgi:uncharacterized repeat protein (TIGR03806 family)
MGIEVRAWQALLSCCLFACGSDDGRAPRPDDAGSAAEGPPASAYEKPPATLAEWRLFRDAPAQLPGSRVLPYEVIAPLYSDYTLKHRFVYVPEGEQIEYDATGVWRLPAGSVLIKTFSYPLDARDPSLGERLLETRLLVFTGGKVVPHTYVWDAQQREAKRKVAGATLESEWIDSEGERKQNDYRVPNTNQCYDCHGKPEVADALGLRTRQLDRDLDYGEGPKNQLDHMEALGLFDRTPEPHGERERLVDPFGDADLTLRARAYLDSNCAQCHQRGGDASTSGMWLDWASTGPEQNPTVWGVCKRPTSAGGATCGREVDIWPGEPDKSIYMCRMESTDPEAQMPPVGRNLLHAEGIALLREFIAALPGTCP